MLHGLFLLALADAIVFLLTPLQSSPGSGCQIGKIVLSPLCFSLMCLKAALFWALMSFLGGSNISPNDRCTCLLSPVTKMCHWVKFVIPGLLSLRENPFQRSYLGPCVKHLRKSLHQCYPPVCLNYSNRWSVNFFPEGTNMFPSDLFYQVGKYIWNLAVGSRSTCVTNSNWVITIII